MNTVMLFLLFIGIVGQTAENRDAEGVLVLFRDGSQEEQVEAKRSLLRDYGKPLSMRLQRQLVEIAVSKQMLAGARVDAMEVLIETSADISVFESDFVDIAQSMHSSQEVRTVALMGLQLALRKHKSNDSLKSLFLKKILDKTEYTSARIVAGNALLVESDLPRDKVFDAFARVIDSQDENIDARLSLMRLLGPLCLLAPQIFDRITSLLIRQGCEVRESVHFRAESLTCLADVYLVPPVKLADRTMYERQSRDLVRMIANSMLHRRIRESAGYAVAVCPETDDSIVDELNAILMSSDRFAHADVASALSRLGSKAVSSVPILERILQNKQESPESVEAVEDALLEIDPKAAHRLGIKR